MNRSTDQSELKSDRKATFAICAGLVVAVFCVFSQVSHHNFITVDDDMYVYKNPVVASGLTWKGVGWAFTHGYAANWHPLTWLSHMLDFQIYGLRAGGHHITNIILHAANAVLLFLVLRRLTGAIWSCAFVAALFAIHPLRVESVAWVAERKDVLSGLFFILTIWAYARYAEARSWKRYAVMTVCFAFGLMAKPMLVTLPFVLLLLDCWPLRRFQPSAFLKLIVEKTPLLALAVGSSVLTIWAQRQVGAIKTAADLEFSWRLGNAAVSYVTYIGQMIFPHQLAPYYPHLGHTLPMIEILGSALLLGAITVAVAYWGRRFAYLPVGWFWYLGMLVPVIGLVQVGAQGHADRYTYLPQIGLYLIVVWGLTDISRRWPQHRLKFVIAGAACLAILTACAWRQTRLWGNSEALWKHALACNPESSWIEKTLGSVLSDNGKLDEAILHYQRGAQISPGYAGLRLNLSNALYQKSRLTEAQQEVEAALQADPELIEAHVSLGVLLYLRGQLETAIQHFQKVLARNPAHTAALSNLGVALEGLGRTNEAVARYHQALSINPASAGARRNLARVLLGRGQAAEAIPHYEQALNVSPNDVSLRGDLADALARTGQFDRASAELRQALTLLGTEHEEVAQKFRERLMNYQTGRLEPATP